MKALSIALLVVIAFTLACGVSNEEYDALVSELAVTRQQLNDLQLQLNAANQDFHNSQEQLNMALAQFHDLTDRSTKLESDLEEATQTLSEHKSELETNKTQLAQQSTEISDLSDELTQRSEVISSLESERASLEEARETLQADFEELDSEYAELSEQMASLEQEKTAADITIQSNEILIQSLERDVQSITAENSLLQTELEANSSEFVQAEINDLKAERDEWVRKINELKELAGPLLEDEELILKVSHLACTGSMLPLLHCGDLTLQQTNVSYFNIEVGDIIAFRRRDCSTGQSIPNVTILHRVVDIDSGWFITKGDNNYRSDSCRLSMANIESKVIGWVKGIFPEDYFKTDNFEREKSELNDMLRTYDRKRADYDEQLEKLDDAEDQYKDGEISYSSYRDVWEETEDDRLDLLDLTQKVNSQYAKFKLMQDLIVARNYNDDEWAE